MNKKPKKIKPKMSPVSQEIKRCALLTELWNHAQNLSLSELEELIKRTCSINSIPEIHERY